MTATGLGALALSCLPAGATGLSPAANSFIVGSGSQVAYNVVQGLEDLFNSSPACQMYVAQPTSVNPQQYDFSCVPAGSATSPASPSTTPENPFGDVATEEPPIGGNNGIKQLEYQGGVSPAGHAPSSVNTASGISFATAPRPIVQGAKGDYTGLNFVAYAKDGASWFHYSTVSGQASASSAVTSLSQAQLQGIYNGSINNWSQVGGANAPIVVVSAPAGAGIQGTWKTYLGFDPTLNNSTVNCVNPGSVGASTSTGASGCVGPMVVFQNEDAQIKLSAFASNQQSFVSGGGAFGTKTATTTLAAAAPAGSTSISLTSAAHISAGISLRLGGVTAGEHVTVASVAGATVTLTTPTVKAHVALTGVTFSYNIIPTDNVIRKDAIFFYSTGQYSTQCLIGQSLSVKKNTCGGSLQPTGTTNTLGQIQGVAPTESNILLDVFPVTTYLYNVYANGSNPLLGPAATPATVNLISEIGFICKPQNATITDPNGSTYLADIQKIILANGFYPLSDGANSGTVNQTPLADEGFVSHPAANLIVGTKYEAYDNVPATSLPGGYQGGTNPSGFCAIASTEDNGSGNPS